MKNFFLYAGFPVRATLALIALAFLVPIHLLGGMCGGDVSSSWYLRELRGIYRWVFFNTSS